VFLTALPDAEFVARMSSSVMKIVRSTFVGSRCTALDTEDYPWSSARAHCGRIDDGVLTKNANWGEQLRTVDDGSAWLAESDQAEQLAVLRRHVERGLLCGAEEFVRGLELLSGQVLQPTLVGRPKTIDRESAA
jgi:hypothetical protein